MKLKDFAASAQALIDCGRGEDEVCVWAGQTDHELYEIEGVSFGAGEGRRLVFVICDNRKKLEPDLSANMRRAEYEKGRDARRAARADSQNLAS